MSNEKQNNATAKSQPLNMGGVIGGLSSSRDFIEDFQHENGCYQNECVIDNSNPPIRSNF